MGCIGALKNIDTVSGWQGAGRGVQQVALGKRKAGNTPGSVYSLAMNVAGTVLAAGTAQHVIRICDARSGSKVMKLRGHTGNIRCFLRILSCLLIFIRTSLTAVDLCDTPYWRLMISDKGGSFSVVLWLSLRHQIHEAMPAVSQDAAISWALRNNRYITRNQPLEAR